MPSAINNQCVSFDLKPVYEQFFLGTNFTNYTNEIRDNS